MDREHILAEIRRCAAANGGEPLGRLRFEQETGVREADWAGRYWNTWSDAVREAGFEPNRLNAAYDDDHLLRYLADLVRRLGHFPVRNELRLARREDPGFPSANTYARFGSKAQLAARLLTWCEANDGYEDVAARCRPLAEQARADADPDEDADAGPAPGYVYLVRSGRHYKVGRTNAVGRREYEIALQLPERLELVHQIATDDMVGIERYWHERFGERRANGEWFRLTAADVRSFKRRKFM